MSGSPAFLERTVCCVIGEGMNELKRRAPKWSFKIKGLIVAERSQCLRTAVSWPERSHCHVHFDGYYTAGFDENQRAEQFREV